MAIATATVMAVAEAIVVDIFNQLAAIVMAIVNELVTFNHQVWKPFLVNSCVFA